MPSSGIAPELTRYKGVSLLLTYDGEASLSTALRLNG